MTQDCWAEWLLRTRFGGAAPPRGIEPLTPVRERVLAGAAVGPGDTVLDVGCGDGLIAFGALELGAAEVIFSDISRDLLEHAQRLAEEAGVAARCRFLEASADDLDALTDGSVDVVTTRSVLIYVEDKQAAFAEFHRVLRPGGRMSLFEPINRFAARFRVEETFWGYALDDLPELTGKVQAVFAALQPDTDPMLDFDERDLLELAAGAGFRPVELTLEAEVAQAEAVPWEQFASAPGNPRIPSLIGAIEQALTPHEAKRFVAHLAPLVEAGHGTRRSAKAYLRGTKLAG